ncbi:MAG: CRTAC1 family protein, partial [Planctomycetes bacterium]|nr:CRTAC1 family protein [Planctomycetota bacterium]
WRNRGDGTFADATADAGLDYAFPGPPECLAACDYDGDGRLDLFVGCFEHPDPKLASIGQPAFLFRNTGRGRFEDATQASGISAGGNYCTRGAAWGDFNNDGRPDLYVANYRLQPNQLWVNRGGRFTDDAAALGVRGTPGTGQYAVAFGHSVAAAWGDLDNDGDLDLGVTNVASTRFLEFSDPLALYINGGKKDNWHFQDALWTSGIRFQEMAAEMGFCDVDNDGDLDVLLTAMFKERPTALYQNVGSNKFQPVTWRSGLRVFNAWGQAWFDKDNDGDMDVAVGSAEGLRLFENKMGESSWLRVQLAGKRSNALGIGARVSVVAGALTQIRETTCGSGTTSQSSAVAHFGLGSHKGTAEITVRWPDGREQRLPASPINKLVKIEEQ